MLKCIYTLCSSLMNQITTTLHPEGNSGPITVRQLLAHRSPPWCSANSECSLASTAPLSFWALFCFSFWVFTALPKLSNKYPLKEVLPASSSEAVYPFPCTLPYHSSSNTRIPQWKAYRSISHPMLTELRVNSELKYGMGTLFKLHASMFGLLKSPRHVAVFTDTLHHTPLVLKILNLLVQSYCA